MLPVYPKVNLVPSVFTNSFNKLKRAVAARGFAYNVGVLAGGTALAQGIGVLTAPILSRLYTPEDFGLLGVYVSIFGILLAVNSLRYEYAISLPKADDEAANLLALTLLLVVITTVLFEIALWLLGEPLAAWANAPALRPYLWLLPLSLLGAGFYQALNYWAIRKQAFGSIARTRFTQSFAGAVVPIFIGLAAAGPVGLLVGHILSQFIGSGGLARQAWQRDQAVLRQISPGGMWRAARAHYRFPVISSWSAILNAVGLNAPRLLLSSLYGTDVAGWFLFGQRLISIPLTLVGTSVGQVFLGAASRLANENPAGLEAFYLKTARRLFLIGLLPTALLMLAGRPFFAWIFGPEWETAGLYTQIMAPVFLVQFVSSSLSLIMMVIQRQGAQLVWDILRLTLVILALWGASALGMDGTAAVALYAGSMVLTYLLLFGMQWQAARRFSLQNHPVVQTQKVTANGEE